MSLNNDYLNQLLAQGLGQGLAQAAWQPISPSPVSPNLTPPEAEPEFNLALLTGDDDEA